MRHFTAAETHGNLHTVAVCQELLGVFQLGVEIAHINARGHPNLLDLHHMLVLSGFLFPLALLELVLAVVHQLAHGGHCLRRNFHQIQPTLICNAQSLLRGNNAHLLAGLTDEADLFVADLLVQFMLQLANGRNTSIQK